MFDAITAITTNLFRTYITKRFMGVFFEQGSVSKKRESITYGLFYVLTTMIYLLLHYPPLNIATNIVLMYVIACMYEGERKKKIVITLLIYGINMFCDVLAMYAFSGYTYKAGEDYNLVVGYITVLLIALCEFFIERALKKHEKGNDAPPYWKMILFVPVLSIAVLLVLIMSNLNNRTALVATSAGILVINLMIFYLYNAIIDAYRKVEENAAYEVQIASYANQLEVLGQTEETVNALRHDMKHHLSELYAMSKENANTEIVTYIQDMQEFMLNDSEYVRSGNKEIDSVFNYMLSKANKVLDRVEYKINIPATMKIKPFDITVLFGNLMENAIDAAVNSENEKWVYVSLQYEKGMLFIEVKNSYLKINKSGDKYLSTKAGKGHGIGLRNVNRIVSAYQGTMEITDTDNIFDVKILLYI